MSMQSSVNHLLSELLITGFAGEPEISIVPMAAVTSKISNSSKTESKKIEIFLHCSVGDEGPKSSNANTVSKSASAVLTGNIMINLFNDRLRHISD